MKMNVNDKRRAEKAATDLACECRAKTGYPPDIADIAALILKAVEEERGLTRDWLERRSVIADDEADDLGEGPRRTKLRGAADALLQFARDLEAAGPPR